MKPFEALGFGLLLSAASTIVNVIIFSATEIRFFGYISVSSMLACIALFAALMISEILGRE